MLMLVVARALSPALVSQCFLADVLRSSEIHIIAAFEHCWAPPYPTTTKKRMLSLTRLSDAARLMLNVSGAAGDALRVLHYRLLLTRLKQGPDEAWATLDETLLKAYDGVATIPPVRGDVMAVVSVLREQTWGLPGDKLLDLGRIYLQSITPLLDSDTTNAISQSLPFLKVKSEKVVENGDTATHDRFLVDPDRVTLWDLMATLISDDDPSWIMEDKQLQDSQIVFNTMSTLNTVFSRFDIHKHGWYQI